MQFVQHFNYLYNKLLETYSVIRKVEKVIAQLLSVSEISEMKEKHILAFVFAFELYCTDCFCTPSHKLEAILPLKVTCLNCTNIYMKGSHTRTIYFHESCVGQISIFCRQHVGEHLVQILLVYVLSAPS